MAFKTRTLVILSILVLGVLPDISRSYIAFAQGTPNPSQLPGAGGRNADGDPERVRREREMQKQANKERQAKLARDTEQLLKLATELKEYVDKTNENTLSIEVIKKAEEIEKLAHSVRQKMRGNY